MIGNRTSRSTSHTRRAAPVNSPALVDGLFADPCWPDSTGDTRCVLCGKPVENRYMARATHAALHADEVWTHRDVLGRTVWFPKDRL